MIVQMLLLFTIKDLMNTPYQLVLETHLGISLDSVPGAESGFPNQNEIAGLKSLMGWDLTIQRNRIFQKNTKQILGIELPPDKALHDGRQTFVAFRAITG